MFSASVQILLVYFRGVNGTMSLGKSTASSPIVLGSDSHCFRIPLAYSLMVLSLLASIN